MDEEGSSKRIYAQKGDKVSWQQGFQFQVKGDARYLLMYCLDYLQTWLPV